MRQNTRHLVRLALEFAIENDFTLPDKGRRVDRLADIPVGIKLPAACAQCGQEAYRDGGTLKPGQPFPRRFNVLVGAAVVFEVKNRQGFQLSPGIETARS